ncbi:MAG: class I SAM-dependent methyltransferase [Microthrixaceae bacterium]
MAIKRNGIVPEDLARYVAEHSETPDDVLVALSEVTERETGSAAGMQIGSDQGVLLEMLVRATGRAGRSNWEPSPAIRRFTSRGLGEHGTLLCCDLSEEWTTIAREYWRRAGVEDRIELRLGPALRTLSSLGDDDQFDFAFVDAHKPEYAAYIEALHPHLRPGALVAVDNTLWSGRVLSPPSDAATDPDTAAIAAFNDSMAAGARFMTVVLAIGDGLTLLQRR